MRYINTVCTFMLFACAISLFSYVGLVVLGFGGVTVPLLPLLGRAGFLLIAVTLGTIAGVVAGGMYWLSTQPRTCSR